MVFVILTLALVLSILLVKTQETDQSILPHVKNKHVWILLLFELRN
jgi:hypothetical protein